MSWKEISDGSFKGYVFHVAVPKRGGSRGATSIQTELERKIQIMERAGVDGADINDFGRKAEVVTAELVFVGEGYEEEVEKFRKICNEGTAGLLILPDRKEAIMAKFHKGSFKIEVGSGRTKTVNVVWIEDQSSVTKYASTAGTVTQSANDYGTVASNTVSSIDRAKSSIEQNAFLNAVKSIDQGISLARSSVNSALRLTGEARGNISSITDRILGNLEALRDSLQKVQNYVSSRDGGTASVSQFDDVDNGVVVADYTEPDDIPVPKNPLAKPPVSADTVAPPAAVQSEAVAENSLRDAAVAIKKDRDALTEITDGKTDDVAQALTAVINDARSVAVAISTKPKTAVIVPFEMSLLEVMFHNEILWDDLYKIVRGNSHIADTLRVAAGEVVYL